MFLLPTLLLTLQVSPETDADVEWAAQLARQQQEDTEARAAFATIQGYAEIGCNDLYYCLDLFDRLDHPSIRAARLEYFRSRFHQHSERARDIFLERLISENSSERIDARNLLMDWGNWNSGHAARLRSLIDENNTREAYQVLGSIGSLEIIQDLFAALEADAENWGAIWALGEAAQSNPDAIKTRLGRYIRDGNDILIWRTTNLFHDVNLDDDRIRVLALAGANPALPLEERAASLRVLMALSRRAGPAEAVLSDFRSRAEPDLQSIVDRILMNVGNSTFVAEFAATCSIYEAEFDPYYRLHDNCPHRYLSDLGEAGSGAGPALLRLLNSPHPDQRVEALQTLGSIGYRTAIPRILPLLTSSNWREVRWAIAALESYQAEEAVPALQAVAAAHWLPDLREEAARAVTRIESGVVPIEDDETEWIRGWDLLNPPNCPSGQWSWQGRAIPQSRYQWEDREGLNDEISTQVPSGRFTGTNRGEWGGELTWYPSAGYETELVPENVLALHPYDEGTIVAVGLAHLSSNRGEILRVEIRPDGEPVVHRVAELPEAPYGGLSHVDGRNYAAFGRGYAEEPHRHFVTVFDAEAGVLGLAECVGGTED